MARSAVYGEVPRATPAIEDAVTRPMRKPDPELARLATWTKLLDRFIDPIVGLVAPGIGDALGSMLGLGVIATAVRRKLPAIVIARMLLNLAIDAIFGAVPLLGDIFDFAFQANRKNYDLLVARYDARKSTGRDWAIVGVAVALLVGAVIGTVWVAYEVVAWTCHALP